MHQRRVVLEWGPWIWDLWDTPEEPDDDDASLDLYQERSDEALKSGRERDGEMQRSHSAPRIPAPQTIKIPRSIKRFSGIIDLTGNRFLTHNSCIP